MPEENSSTERERKEGEGLTPAITNVRCAKGHCFFEFTVLI